MKPLKTRLPGPSDTYNTQIVTIYAHPEADTKYSIGLDAATGCGGDYTYIPVWSHRIPFEQVAWLRSRTITTVQGSEVLWYMARYYNKAFIVPETRYPGNAYVDNLIEVYAYGNIFKRTQDLDEDPSVSSKYGICTTEADKNLLVNDAKRLLENRDGPQVIFHDPVSIQEMCNFVYIEDKRKMGAGEGFNDDTVMGNMLAWQGCILKPQPPKPKVSEHINRNEEQAHKEYLMKRHKERILEPKHYLQPV
jgi:hypothetical protein